MVVYEIQSPRKKRSFSFFEKLNLTNKLIFINVVAFIVFSILLAAGIVPVEWIAIMPSNVLSGKYLWTFITSMFMHGGFFHLFANMLSLYFVGTLIERIIGRKRYLRFYLLAGILSSVLFVISAPFLGDLNTFAVGASGALFGLIGMLIFLTPNLPVYMMFIPIPIKMKYAAPGMLVLLWVISLGAGLPIGNVAHLGGLLAGLVYGFVLKKEFPKKVAYIQKRFS